jgi:hypothetical protein
VRGDAILAIVIKKQRGNVGVPASLQIILQWMRSEAPTRLAPFIADPTS